MDVQMLRHFWLRDDTENSSAPSLERVAQEKEIFFAVLFFVDQTTDRLKKDGNT